LTPLASRVNHFPSKKDRQLTHILGITGFIGSGKDTAAEYLIQNYGFKGIKFADGLKDMMRAIGLTTEEMEDRKLKEEPHPLLCGRSPRYAMQKLGTEWGRDLIADELWTSLWASRCNGKRLVVTADMRFFNEAAIIEKNNGILIRIFRPETDPPRETWPDLHPSEREIPNLPVHYEVQNVGTITELCKTVYGLAFHKPKEL
jgi:hypothetical protein